MPRKIYLLRHAQAENSFAIGDKERMLTDFGKEQGFNVGLFLKNHVIETVLCSEAKRTQQTLEQLQKAGASFNKIDILEKFYNAPAEILFEAIEETENNVLAIAHNPGIHHLAFQLAKEGEPHLIDQLAMGYPPATLSVFEENKLIELIIPD
jgi:phosphohistidine phosphatase